MSDTPSKLPAQARVVIIGGGVVGASALYHLAKAGWTDCVLLEKNELTAGSTWHAAGNIPTFSSSWSIMNMQRYSTELYRGLGAEVDYPMNYHVTGSIRLAHSKERMQEFQRVKSMGRYQGMEIDMCSNADLKDRYPFMETHDLEGGLYDPFDGDMDPAQLTQALAKGARDMGAKIVRFCPATGLRRENDEWIVDTEQGEVRCDVIVNAAGYYAQRVAEWYKPFASEGLARTLPMMVMSHQYLLTDEIPELEDWSK
ncbi:MAG: FAD-binding oxidoreductase, partial [Pseudomonadota bacterium]